LNREDNSAHGDCEAFAAGAAANRNT